MSQPYFKYPKPDETIRETRWLWNYAASLSKIPIGENKYQRMCYLNPLFYFAAYYLQYFLLMRADGSRIL